MSSTGGRTTEVRWKLAKRCDTRWKGRLGVAGFVGILMVLLLGEPGGAEPQPPRLTMVDQTIEVSPNGQWRATIRVDGIGDMDQSELSIAVVFFTIIENEADLNRTPSRPINRVGPYPLSTLREDFEVFPDLGRASNPDGIEFQLEVPVRSGEPIDDLRRVRLPDPGVYPLRVELRLGSEIIAAKRLNLIRLGRDGPTWLPPEIAGAVRIGGASAIAMGDGLDLLERYPAGKLLVVLDSNVLTHLRSDPKLAQRWKVALAGRPVVAFDPNVDPSSLDAIGHGDLYGWAAARMRQDVEFLGFNPHPDTTAVALALTSGGARLVFEQGFSTVVDLTNNDVVGVVEVGGQPSLVAVSVDESLFTDNAAHRDSDPAHSAAQFMVRLHARTMESPGPGVLVGTTQTQSVVFLEAILAADERGEVALVEPGHVFGQIEPVSVVAARTPSRDLSELKPSLDRIVEMLVWHEAMYVSGPMSPAAVRNALERAVSNLGPHATVTQDQAESLKAIEVQLSAQLDAVVLPDGMVVTVAARSAHIPLTIENRSEGARRIQLQFRSDKFQVAKDKAIITVEPGLSSIDVQVWARSMGVSPVEVSVWTPDGVHQLDSTQLQVRSTALPGVGLAVAFVGLFGLGVWWIIYHRKARRSGMPVGSQRA